MKTLLALTFVSLAVIGLAQTASAGPERMDGKDKVVQPIVEPCDWYRANEWDVSIWFAAAFPADKGRFSLLDVAERHETLEGPPGTDNHEDNVGSLSNDRFLNKENAFGGGADFKYFLNQNFGLGVEGFVLGAHDAAGEVLGTITIRWPIGCSRFAPYVYVGGGVAFGGSHDVASEFETPSANTSAAFASVTPAPGTVVVHGAVFSRRTVSDNAKAAGQVGGGMEYRFTHHIGLMTDFSWNFVGTSGDFGMVRSGVTFGF
jgi:hypothetical protein